MKITAFNVQNGSATLLHLPGSPSRVGIFDCYTGPNGLHPLLQELDALEALYPGDLEIEFLALSHFHYDHFLGLRELLGAYGDRIKRLFDPGIHLRATATDAFPTGRAVHVRARDDLMALEAFLRTSDVIQMPLTQPGLPIYEDQKHGVRIHSVAPDPVYLRRLGRGIERRYRALAARLVRGEEIEPDDLIVSDDKMVNLNHTSSALMVQFGASRALLGGDVLKRAWNQLVRRYGVEVAASAVLLSHHGSHTGFPARTVWEASFHRDGQHAVVSGRGPHRPSAEVAAVLHDAGVSLWSTNPTKTAVGAMLTDPVERYVATLHFGESRTYPEAGHVQITLGINGSVETVGPKQPLPLN